MRAGGRRTTPCQITANNDPCQYVAAAFPTHSKDLQTAATRPAGEASRRAGFARRWVAATTIRLTALPPFVPSSAISVYAEAVART
jgi:hypothetical protein